MLDEGTSGLTEMTTGEFFSGSCANKFVARDVADSTGNSLADIRPSVQTSQERTTLHQVREEIAQEAGVDAVNGAQGTFDFFVRRFGGVIGCIAGEIRGKGRQESTFARLLTTVYHLGRTLQRDSWNVESTSTRKVGRHQRIDKQIDPHSSDLGFHSVNRESPIGE